MEFQNLVNVFKRARYFYWFWALPIQSIRFHYIPLRSIIIFPFHLILGLPSVLNLLKFQTFTDAKKNVGRKYNVQPSEIRCAIHLCRQTPVVKGIIKFPGSATVRGRKLIFPGAEVTRQSEDERGPWPSREVSRSVSVRCWPAPPRWISSKWGGKWRLALGFNPLNTELNSICQ